MKVNKSFPQITGFTLVEVIVSLVILVSGIVIVGQGFSSGLRATMRAEQETIAATLAEAQMARIETGEIGLEQDQQGSFGDTYPGYTWRTTVIPTEYQNLYRVDLEICWIDRREERTFELSRLINIKEKQDEK